MEDVLSIYKTPLDPRYPVICIDETFKQLIGETRQPLPTRPGDVERYDHVYTRKGVSSLFVAFEPLRSWRTIWVADRRRRLEWAQFVSSLIRGRFRRAKKLILVMDQLNTHSAASFYEAFPPTEAQWLASKIEIHYTPKHGRNRVQRSLKTVPRSENRHERNVGATNPNVGTKKKQFQNLRRLAIQNKRRQNQTEITVPVNSALTEH